MRIRAVRVRELGCFSEPVALEGLSGGLDVLAGPNELGKSTILKALQTLFTMRHSTQSKAIERLRPYGGGAPMVEADFEADGRLWRLRKQYLSERLAVLTDLTAAGRVVARGDEAHARALELIGSGGEHRLGLLWLEQGMSLQPLSPKEGEREQLARVIEREIAAASGGGHDLRTIRARAVQQRRQLVTDHKPPRPAGEYLKAITRRNATTEELEAARAEARAAADRITRVTELRSRRAELTDPQVVAALRERVQKLEADCESAAAARQQLKLAETKVQACESRVAEAQQAYALLANMLDESAKLEAAAAAAQPKVKELNEALEALTKAIDAARGERQTLQSALEAAQQRLRAREQLDRQREAAARLDDASRRLAEAQAAAQRAEEIRAELASFGVTEDGVAAAAREASSIEALTARIDAQLPKVRVAYQTGAAGKIRVGGRPVDDGAVLTPSRAMTFEIEGIGTITVDPAVSESIEEDQADQEAHRSVLADLLASMGVADLSTARRRLEERHRLERELAQAEDRIATRAPDGLERLSEEVERLTDIAEPRELDESDLPERSDIEAQIKGVETALRELEQRLEGLSRDQTAAREELAGINAAARAREERLTDLAKALPPVEERSNRLLELENAVAAAQQAMNEAIRERSAWREKAPDDAAMSALESALAQARRHQQSAADEVARVERDLAVLEAQLDRDRQDGIAAKVKALEGELAAHEEQVRRFEREVAAINLLLETLSTVEQQSRERYFQPVLQRLDPYMNLVFPGAKLGLDRDFRVEAIDRGAVREQIGLLSDGTQEQIAVLARLAFARLLADAGRPTPLILDDALVYSDDDRIESLFDALRQAAEAHQVIVFTCRSRTFAQLGGTRLSVAPWTVQ
ncbi:MAG TPA: AAA family ATPase [Hyphomicrobiaceae bacterium]